VTLTVGTEMKRVLVLGEDLGTVLSLARERGFRIVEESPDVVLTWGGDGLLLRSEEAWPGVPKLPLRNSRHGKKCQPHELPRALDDLLQGRLRPVAYTKVRGEARGRVKIGLNDVVVHNARPTSAVRYRIRVDGEELGHEYVGDGVVVATPFGSTAYYRAITRGSFREGLGLAFNNSTEPVDHFVVPERAEIRVLVTRGPAMLVADNQREAIDLDDGDEVVIRKDEGRAVILEPA
jgi:NAD+ kinase